MPAFSNALTDSKSLYLRQHAHNPVMWYPWGERAVSEAKKQDKPLLVSIGYSSCYWCHVMERDVFENTSIAAFMNQHFINVKVDREEHPLVDESLMIARQLLTREGGWPNNVFLTPELKPFYACGTLLARDSGDRPSFPRLLEWLNYQWVEERGDMEKQATEIDRLTRHYLALKAPKKGDEALPLSSLTYHLVDYLFAKHDDMSGGFGGAPKFPQETYIHFLLTIAEIFRHKPALDIARHCLDNLGAGGVYDQVGCGVHRYAVDKAWLVPHFEKMLYNQALCASNYIRAFLLTADDSYQDMARGILEFTAGPMRSEDGPFFAAIDAENDGVEGAYYSWRADEIASVLTTEQQAFFNTHYQLAEIPHFPGHKAPTGHAIALKEPLADAARKADMPYVQLAAMAGQVMNALLAVRNQRQAPALDDKYITSWNGLMIEAMVEGGYRFNQETYKAHALAALRFFAACFERDGGLSHVYYGQEPGAETCLEDYAYLARAALRFHQYYKAESDTWLEFARDLIQQARRLFYDETSQSWRRNQVGGLMDITIQEPSDAVLPSAIAVLLECQLMLAEATQEDNFADEAKRMRDMYMPQIKANSIPEYASLLSSLARLAMMEEDADYATHTATLLAEADQAKPVIHMHAEIDEKSEITAGSIAKLNIHISVNDGWYIDAANQPGSATALDISGPNVAALESVIYPEAELIKNGEGKAGIEKLAYKGDIVMVATILCSEAKNRQAIDIKLTYQPCTDSQCFGKAIAHYRV